MLPASVLMQRHMQQQQQQYILFNTIKANLYYSIKLVDKDNAEF